MSPYKRIKLTPELGPRPVNSPVYAGQKIKLSQFTRLDRKPVTLDLSNTSLLNNISDIVELPSSLPSELSSSISRDELLSQVTPLPKRYVDDSNPLLTQPVKPVFISDFINQVTTAETLAFQDHVNRLKPKKITHPKHSKAIRSSKDRSPIIIKKRLIKYLHKINYPNRPYFTNDAYKELESIMLLVMEKILINCRTTMERRTRRIELSDIVSAEKKLSLNKLKLS